MGFLAGGLALQVGGLWTPSVLPFALLFLLASVSRFASAAFLARQGEPVPMPQENGNHCFCGLFQPRAQGNLGRAILFMLFAQMAVQISAPYFTPYMLCQLKLSYTGYVVLTSAAYVAKIAFLPFAGRMAARWDASRLLWIGGMAIAPVSILWVPSGSFAYLLVAQVISGIAWSIYELAMLLVFVDTIPADRRVRILTVYNLANAVAILIGSLIGGAVLSISMKGVRPYFLVFALSSLFRGIAVLSLARFPRVVPRAVPTMVRAAVPRPVMLSLGRVPAAKAGGDEERVTPREPSQSTPVTIPIPLGARIDDRYP